jgi:hypothetical protein
MKMKILPFLFSIFFVYSFGQAPGNDTVYVESVDFQILTFSRISCENFTTGFRDRIQLRTIVDKDTIAMLNLFIDKAKYAKRDRGVDVRAKFIFEKEDKRQVTICTDGYTIEIDNRLIKYNSKFADFLKVLTLQK